MMKLLPYEIWRDIPGFEGLYKISTQRRIKSLDHTVISNNGKSQYVRHCKGKTIKQVKDGEYYKVSLCKKGIVKDYHIHFLLALVFIPNPHNYPEVDHIIPVKNGGDDSLNNLRWVTKKMNANNELTLKNRSIAQLCVSNKKSQSMKGKCVRKLLQFDKEMNLVNVYPNIKYTCAELGYVPSTIYNAIRTGKKAYGYYWKSE